MISNANNEVNEAETILASVNIETQLGRDSQRNPEVLQSDIDRNIRRLERTQDQIQAAIERYKLLKRNECEKNDSQKDENNHKLFPSPRLNNKARATFPQTSAKKGLTRRHSVDDLLSTNREPDKVGRLTKRRNSTSLYQKNNKSVNNEGYSSESETS